MASLTHCIGSASPWDRSKTDATRRRQRQSDAGTSGGADHTIAEVTVESQHGDPRYLDESRKVLADLRRVWGLDAPQRLDLRASRTPWDHLSEAELVDRVAHQDALLRRTDRILDTPAPPVEDTPS